MLEIRDWEKTPVQTQASVQGPHTNALFARSLTPAKERLWCKQSGWETKPREIERDPVLTANGLCLKLSIKSKGFPAKCLLEECRASERNLKVQLGVNVACAGGCQPVARLMLSPSAEQPSAAALMNESLSGVFFVFQQNNSFCGVICIPMDVLNPLLMLLCVGDGRGGKSWCMSESSQVTSWWMLLRRLMLQV